MNRILTINPINWDLRSPYSFPNLGMPPAGRVGGGAPVELSRNGELVIAGVTLTPYHSNTPGSDHAVSPTYDQAGFSDEQSARIVFSGVGFADMGAYVLQRPSNQRVMLLIQNRTVAQLFFAFDREADNTSCVAIAAGGSREWDIRVPQGNLSLYAAAAGDVVIAYQNNSVT